MPEPTVMEPGTYVYIMPPVVHFNGALHKSLSSVIAISMKLGKYIMPLEAISTVYLIYPSHQ
jgi:quercetin dioxygenase-like cupin family protein